MATAPILLAIAAIGGLVLAVGHLRGKNPPISLALVHGLAAAAGVVFVLVAVMNSASGGLGTVALGLFVAAALGGAVLFVRHLRKQPLPPPLILAHAALAVIGFVFLLVWVM